MSVSGGRVSLDFNHPLAGKEIVYEVKINKQIKDLKEKVEAITEFLFRQPMKFEINEKDKKVKIKAEKQFEQLITLFAQKFKEILELDLEFEEVKEDSSKQSQ
jgi:FKBP-type peptidyl-prolyl cis-trans isomerase 2